MALTDNSDTVFVADTILIQAGDSFNGLGGTDYITIGINSSADVDFSAASFFSCERIQFSNGFATSQATFAAGQFGSGKVELTSVFTGTSTGMQGVVINLAMAGTFNASDFSFSRWTSGTDIFILAGSTGNEMIVGSIQSGWIRGGAGNDSFSGGRGKDTIDAGKFDDYMIGFAGVDFCVTFTAVFTSTAASTIESIISFAIGSGTIFAFVNSVDIITDFAVGTDILSGRNT